MFLPLSSLRAIGPKIAALIEKAAGGGLVRDLLFHLPESYIDRSTRPPIGQSRPGQIVTWAVEVVRHDTPAAPRQPWRVVVADGTGFAELVFFRAHRLRDMPPGARLLVSGKLERFGDRLTMVHPDHVLAAEGGDDIPGLEPVWKLTAGLSGRVLGRAMREALSSVRALPEWHDGALMRREAWPGFAAALRQLQAPEAPSGQRPGRPPGL